MPEITTKNKRPMKKIMFKDKYGLTQAVLEGRKTMTRRLVRASSDGWDEVWVDIDKRCALLTKSLNHIIKEVERSRFSFGEIVAVAQAYKDAWVEWQNLWEKSNNPNNWHTPDAMLGDQADTTHGWQNKMFVKADLMPHQIRITDIKVERLQDISDGDCLKEGIKRKFWSDGTCVGYIFDNMPEDIDEYQTPRKAFEALIDKISGKGTWKANPWVYAYEFELVK